MKIKINNKITFQNTNKPILIAEISGNHCGSKSRFLKHIMEAKKAGADMIKIQTYEENEICINPKYLNKTNPMKRSVKKLFLIYKKYKTPFKWHKDAFILAKKLNIELFSTPFSIKAVDFLESFNQKIYKISSFEINDYQLVKKIASLRKPIIISTGMSSLKEIRRCIKWVNEFHNKIIILYCVSGYPTDESELNLNSIDILKKKFKNNLIGLSDHTNDIYSGLAASTKKISAIEKHFVIDEKKTSDSGFSIKPYQLKKLSDGLKKMENIFGKKQFFLKKSEKKNIKFRRSIYANKNIEKNHIIRNEDLITFRPKIGICASEVKKILNKKAKKNIKQFSPIHKSDFN